MEIEYKGGNCIVVTTKKGTFVVDPNIAPIGLKNPTKGAAFLITQPQFRAPGEADTIIIDGPGEYEVNNVSIRGVSARAHMDADDKSLAATMYRLDVGDTTIAILGHVYPDLTEEQLETLGVVDIVVVPVGGNGYTLDATGAIKLVRQIEPKMVIPTHYADKGISYEVPQAELEYFTKELGSNIEMSPKLKIKGEIPEGGLSVQVITRS